MCHSDMKYLYLILQQNKRKKIRMLLVKKVYISMN